MKQLGGKGEDVAYGNTFSIGTQESSASLWHMKQLS